MKLIAAVWGLLLTAVFLVQPMVVLGAEADAITGVWNTSDNDARIEIYNCGAEYCGRIGIMRDGKLLAIDSPTALKQNALSGQAWEVIAEPLLPALAALEKCPCVLRAGLAGDHLRAISSPGTQAGEMKQALRQANIHLTRLEKVEPTLEDIFLALATH